MPKLSLGHYKNIISGKLKTVPWNLGKHVFLCIVIFILLDLLVGEALFYKYVFLARTQTPPPPAVSAKFQDTIYNSILMQWETNKERLFGTSIKNNNPFE